MITTAQRIKEALQIRNMKQADLVERTKIGKSSISTYLSGAYVPKQNNIYLIAKALNVNEAWLMGYDVSMERTPDISSNKAFLVYVESLGYHIYRDDPEHKPFMGSKDIPSCNLEYNTLDSLKLRIDSYTRAIIDSELLALREEEIRKERLEKEKTIQYLQGENLYKESQLDKDKKVYLEAQAAHERTDIKVTDEMRKHDDDIMDDDKFWNE